ncbi:uncharacterized protein LOC122668147 [Telopea speciosissima]|uniref:uncharacterized protein LOC122668147 n=1 Tax=Telopea speciosissima TaxID=54955 RepID=UPI001CC5C72C|nr:uncharacterized protein LOC122668147 [Telopea speciosissima]
MIGAPFVPSFAALVFFFFNFQLAHVAPQGEVCNSSPACGDVLNIQYPFHLQSDPNNNCTKFPEFQLNCENNQTLLNLQFLKSENYYPWSSVYTRIYLVDEILYHKNLIRIVDPGLQRGNCSSSPLFSNFSDKLYSSAYTLESIGNGIIFVGCSSPVKNDTDYISTSPCLNGSSSVPYSYVLLEKTVSDLHRNCNVVRSSPRSAKGILNHTYPEVHQALLSGFYLRWGDPYVKECPRPFHSSHCFLKLLADVFRQVLGKSFRDPFSKFSLSLLGFISNCP